MHSNSRAIAVAEPVPGGSGVMGRRYQRHFKSGLSHSIKTVSWRFDIVNHRLEFAVFSASWARIRVREIVSCREKSGWRRSRWPPPSRSGTKLACRIGIGATQSRTSSGQKGGDRASKENREGKR